MGTVKVRVSCDRIDLLQATDGVEMKPIWIFTQLEVHMLNVIAINGSPRQAKGNTALILEPFLQGLEDRGANIQLFYASRLKVKPCTCGELACWYRTPGECVLKDAMQELYPQLKQAHILVIASPIYLPMPGDMQNIINRLIPHRCRV